MIKLFDVEDLDQYPLFKISAVETQDTLALELEADLVDWLVNVLVSIPEKFKTMIIHLDIFDSDTPRCRPMKLSRSCGSVLCHTFVFFPNTNQYAGKRRDSYFSQMG